MRKRTVAREYALQLLYQVDIRSVDPEKLLPDFWQENSVPQDVIEFTQRLVRGTTTHAKLIDKTVCRYAENWSLERMAVIDRNIIRMASYELLYTDDIPPKVSINEAVDLAKKFGDDESGAFVNGILDKILNDENSGVKRRG